MMSGTYYISCMLNIIILDTCVTAIQMIFSPHFPPKILLLDSYFLVSH